MKESIQSSRHNIKRMAAAGGAAGLILLTSGCLNDNEKQATDSYAMTHNVSTSCVGNIRSRVSNHEAEGSNQMDTSDMESLGKAACPEVPSATSFKVASLVHDEQDAFNANIVLDGFGASAVVIGGVLLLTFVATREKLR